MAGIKLFESSTFYESVTGNRLFWASMAISLAIHVSVIITLSLTKTKILQTPLKQIEVVYQDIKTQSVKTQQISKDDLKLLQGEKRETPLKKIDVLDKDKEMFSPGEERFQDVSKFKGKLSMDKKEVPRFSTAEMDRKVTVPYLKTEKISNPSYLSYNENLRMRIRERAYTYVNDKAIESGEVYLTFLLSSDGEIQGIKILGDKTRANDYLREIAMRSVKESSPFPPFPQGVNYPELTFNLLISFKK
jgi:outer membrane biosynthesis protein TonB